MYNTQSADDGRESMSLRPEENRLLDLVFVSTDTSRVDLEAANALALKVKEKLLEQMCAVRIKEIGARLGNQAGEMHFNAMFGDNNALSANIIVSCFACLALEADDSPLDMLTVAEVKHAFYVSRILQQTKSPMLILTEKKMREQTEDYLLRFILVHKNLGSTIVKKMSEAEIKAILDKIFQQSFAQTVKGGKNSVENRPLTSILSFLQKNEPYQLFDLGEADTVTGVLNGLQIKKEHQQKKSQG